MGVEPTQDGSTAPQTVLKTAPVTGPGAAPLFFIIARDSRGRSHSGDERLRYAADHFFDEIGIRGGGALVQSVTAKARGAAGDAE